MNTVDLREIKNQHVRELSLVNLPIPVPSEETKMTKTSEQTTETNRNRKSLTHTQFYKACEMMKENKGIFLEERPTQPQGAVMLSKMCGFPVSPYAFAEVKEAIGLSYITKQEKREKDPKAKSIRSNALRTLCVAVKRLYKKLGEEMPKALEELCNEMSPYIPVDKLMEEAQRGDRPS